MLNGVLSPQNEEIWPRIYNILIFWDYFKSEMIPGVIRPQLCKLCNNAVQAITY